MSTNIPTDIQQGIREQEEIGWKQLLHGRLSYQWSIIITNHLSSKNIDNLEMYPLVWGRRIVRLLLDLSVQLWNQRNSDGYLLTPHQHESALNRNTLLLQRIQFLQKSNPDIPRHHRDFIYQPMDIIAKYPNSNLQSWLKIDEYIIRFYNRRRQAPADISQFWISQPNDPGPVPHIPS